MTKESMLTILDVVYRPCPGGTKGYATVRCACGVLKKGVNLDNVRRGRARSCGCLRKKLAGIQSISHGEARNGKLSVEYQCWRSMHKRCSNKNDKAWKNYGGRGIKVCERWGSYENFLADVGRRPDKFHSIDRIDNEGNYEPGNVRWATRAVQSSNRRKWGKK